MDRAFDSLALDIPEACDTGFSAGSRLSLGLTNGELFTRVIGSRGVHGPAQRRGKTSIFVSHGTRDGDRAGAAVADRSATRSRGYDVAPGVRRTPIVPFQSTARPHWCTAG